MDTAAVDMQTCLRVHGFIIKTKPLKSVNQCAWKICPVLQAKLTIPAMTNMIAFFIMEMEKPFTLDVIENLKATSASERKVSIIQYLLIKPYSSYI